jgi:hemoglobin
MTTGTAMQAKEAITRHETRDLNSPEAISDLVDAFYARVLVDPTLAPMFTQVAEIDLDHHLPTIKAFWRKMLLGRPDYDRNMVARHAAVHSRMPLTRRHFDRWLASFTRTIDERFEGPGADRTRTLAVRIAANLERNLGEYAAHGITTRT